ncbi:ATP-dependent helicase [Neomicrococcus lactis]
MNEAMNAKYSPRDLAAVLNQFRGKDMFPTADQERIIEAPLTPLLVVAGAGSGKTATMADRVVWLVANGFAKPDEILGVTFTRKAAGELTARINAQLEMLRRGGIGDESEAVVPPTISTYHSYANELVKDYGLRLGVEPDARLLGEAEAWQIAHRIVRNYSGDPTFLNGVAASTITKAVLTFSGEMAEHRISLEQASGYLRELREKLEELPTGRRGGTQTLDDKKLLTMLRHRELVTSFVGEYQRYKHEHELLDYGDLIAIAAEIAEKVPVARATERERFKVVLLDEFQDTSHAQMVLFSKIFGDGHPVTAVGDPNQSIYGFRGASAGQLNEFPHQFPIVEADGNRRLADVAYLTTAWRNSRIVLGSANKVAAPLLIASEQNERGVPLKRLTESPMATNGRVHLAFVESEAKEAALIAEALDSEIRPGLDGKEPLKSAAVLSRTRAGFTAIAQALEERGLPYEITGLGGLLDAPEVGVIVSTLHVISNPHRPDHLWRLLAGARWRLGAADLMALSEWSKELERRRTPARKQSADPDEPPFATELLESATLIEAIEELPPVDWAAYRSGRQLSEAARERLTRLSTELKALRQHAHDDLGDLVRLIERTTQLDIELDARPWVDHHSGRKQLDVFFDVVDDFVRSAERPRLQEFLDWLDAAADHEDGLELAPDEPKPGTIQILTVHASKGLEWDIVAVPSMTEKKFPSMSKSSRWTSGSSALPWELRGDRHSLPQWRTDGETLKEVVDAEKEYADDEKHHRENEERRLAYVALTRAKDFLLCTTAAYYGSAVKPQAPSPFILDVKELSESSEVDGQTSSISVLTWLSEEEIPEENPEKGRDFSAVWPFDPLSGPTVTMRKADGSAPLVTPPPTSRRPALEALAEEVQQGVGQWNNLREQSGELQEGTEPASLIQTKQGRELLDEVLSVLTRRMELSGSRAVHAVGDPKHLSPSMMVEAANDPAGARKQYLRPVPTRPSKEAHLGNLFHEWVERFYKTPVLLDIEDVMPATDEDVLQQLEVLKDKFRDSEWSSLQAEEVEVPFDQLVAGVPVRGRIDAVFKHGDAYEIVDWKTGHVPSGQDRENKKVQLSMYRLAFARARGVDPERVSAAFYYVNHGKTLRFDTFHSEEELEALIETYRLAGTN